ncbi:hypothetical protein AI3067V1_5250 (plasmid) [Klebsiella pneumoniae]|nr:hypothetical protein AI3067V1_5250 [Klebsiella pneumoniae]
MIPYIVLSFFGGVALGFIICHGLIKKFARNLHFCSSTGRLLQSISEDGIINVINQKSASYDTSSTERYLCS